MDYDNMHTCLVLLLVLFPYNLGLEIQCCRKPPSLVINGTDIFHKAIGKHVLVAFVEGSNKHSKKQVRGLDLMLHNYENRDIFDIAFIAINKKNDKDIRHLKKRARFEIYQEPPNNDIWKSLGVQTNDFLVFDHCGYMVGYLGYPCSFLLKQRGREYTEKLIERTYSGYSPCRKRWQCRERTTRSQSVDKKHKSKVEEQRKQQETLTLRYTEFTLVELNQQIFNRRP